MYAAAQAALQLPGLPTLPSDLDGESLQPGMGLKQKPPLSSVASRPISIAVHSSSRPTSGAADRELQGSRRPVSGAAGMGVTGNSRPLSGASGRDLTGNTLPVGGAAGMGSTGNSPFFSGRSQASRRPISALLNGSKELADLVSVSKPRYTDQSAAPSLEPSAEVLHGQYISCTVHVAPASRCGPMLQQDCSARDWGRIVACCYTYYRCCVCAHACTLLNLVRVIEARYLKLCFLVCSCAL